MEFVSKFKHKALNGQTREVIANVIHFMQREAEANGPIKDFKKVQERVALDTGISVRSVQKIAHEMRAVEDGESSSFSTPGKKRRKPVTKTDVDDFDKVYIQFLHNRKKFQRYVAYIKSLKTIIITLALMKVCWRKTKTYRKLLMEKTEIQQMRLNYLRNMKQFRYIHYNL